LAIMPDAILNVHSAGSLSYSLPTTRLDTLQRFFSFLESESPQSDDSEKDQPKDDEPKVMDMAIPEKAKKKQKTGKGGGLISDWGISQTTLEEVFMRLTHGDSFTFKQASGRVEEETGESNGDDDNNVGALAVALEESPDSSIALIPVNAQSSLTDIRHELRRLQVAPAHYSFLQEGQPVVDETVQLAVELLPLILIRKKQPTGPATAEDLQERIDELTVILHQSEKRNQSLEKQIKELNDRLQQYEGRAPSSPTMNM